MADELSDLSGANKPIEIKLFGPDQKVLRSIAEQVGEILEKEGKDKHRGIKEVTTNVYAGNPDLIVQLDAAKAERLGLKPDAVARQLRAMFLGQIAATAQESSRADNRRPRSLSRFISLRPGTIRRRLRAPTVDHAAAGRTCPDGSAGRIGRTDAGSAIVGTGNGHGRAHSRYALSRGPATGDFCYRRTE